MEEGKRFLRRIVDFIPFYDEKGRIDFSMSKFILECGHSIPASPPCCRYSGVHTMDAKKFISSKELGMDWKRINMRKHCIECERGKPPIPKCEKTQLPLNLVTLGDCRKNCSIEQIEKCIINEMKRW